MFASQRCVFNKRGLGHQPKKYLKNYFIKAKQSYDQNQTCHYCKSIGHLIYVCPIKKNKVGNMTLVPKGTTNNQKGHNNVWVPKVSSRFCVCKNQENMGNHVKNQVCNLSFLISLF
jgi:hypothetical protein